jgi:thiamine biosynthesis lipoprotein
VRYHHLIDPDTGYPARGCRSVTVLAKEAVLTDGFSTGVFVMGPEKGLRLLKELGLEGIIVDKEGKVHLTDGIKDRLEWTDSTYNSF